MAKVIINKERCKGCKFCIHFCPKQLFALSQELTSNGTHYAYLLDEEKCTGCNICVQVCPDVAIEIQENI